MTMRYYRARSRRISRNRAHHAAPLSCSLSFFPSRPLQQRMILLFRFNMKARTNACEYIVQHPHVPLLLSHSVSLPLSLSLFAPVLCIRCINFERDNNTVIFESIWPAADWSVSGNIRRRREREREITNLFNARGKYVARVANDFIREMPLRVILRDYLDIIRRAHERPRSQRACKLSHRHLSSSSCLESLLCCCCCCSIRRPSPAYVHFLCVR